MKGVKSTEVDIALLYEKLNTFQESSKAAHTQAREVNDQILRQALLTNGKIKDFTEYKVRAEATVVVLKWIVATLGLSNIWIVLQKVIV